MKPETEMAVMKAHFEKSKKELGLVDAEGNIDMELVRKGVEGGISACGGELYVKKLGIWLSADDLSKMIGYVETGAQ